MKGNPINSLSFHWSSCHLWQISSSFSLSLSPFLTTTSDFKEKTKKTAKRLLRVHVFYALEKVEVVFP